MKMNPYWIANVFNYAGNSDYNRLIKYLIIIWKQFDNTMDAIWSFSIASRMHIENVLKPLPNPRLLCGRRGINRERR
jgi:hypothetical protein